MFDFAGRTAMNTRSEKRNQFGTQKKGQQTSITALPPASLANTTRSPRGFLLLRPLITRTPSAFRLVPIMPFGKPLSLRLAFLATTLALAHAQKYTLSQDLSGDKLCVSRLCVPMRDARAGE